jgi:hypothetical protein
MPITVIINDKPIVFDRKRILETFAQYKERKELAGEKPCWSEWRDEWNDNNFD